MPPGTNPHPRPHEPPTIPHLTVEAAEAHLARDRAASQSRLKDAWESIFARYSQDFSGVADEIDTLTGAVVVDNGHLRSLGGGVGGFDWGGDGDEWVDEEEEEEEECRECRDRDELDDSVCRGCGGGGGRGNGVMRSSPPEAVLFPPTVPAATVGDWRAEQIAEWVCALVKFPKEDEVEAEALRSRVVAAGVTGGYLLAGLKFEELKEVLGISSFSKRMELWNEVLKLRGGGSSTGGITDSSPCLPMPLPVVDSLEGDADADTPTHTARGKALAKGGKRKVMVVGLASPRMASAGTSDTPRQKWRGGGGGERASPGLGSLNDTPRQRWRGGSGGERASPGLGSLNDTPDTISTETTVTATPTQNIKHHGKVKKLPSPGAVEVPTPTHTKHLQPKTRKLPSPTSSITGTPRPTTATKPQPQPPQPRTQKQESPDIITTSTPTSTNSAKTPHQKPKPKLTTIITTPSIPATPPAAVKTPTQNTNPWAPPPITSDPFYSPIWNDEHPDGTPLKFPPSLPLHLPLPSPLPLPAKSTASVKKKKARSISTTPTVPTAAASTSTSARAKPLPFLTPAPQKRKRASSVVSAMVGVGWTGGKRRRLAGKSFLGFGGREEEDGDEISSGSGGEGSPVEGRRKKGEGNVKGKGKGKEVEQQHKCRGGKGGFCFECLDLEGEEDDLV